MNRYGKRCVLYPRVSTEMQVDGYSLEGQKNMLTRFADREEMIIVDTYEDAGKSGKSIEGRPAFQKMLRDIEDGLDIDYILVYKLSRFGRNAADILNSLELVQSYGVNLICIEEGIDSSQTSGKLLISVLSAVAEIERENIIEQTMNGRREKARQGGWNGGFAPYGYTLEDNKLMIEETEAVAIRKIFELYTSSEIGLGGIANQLNLQGIRKIPRQNGTLEDWTGHFIKLILDNPVYCGKIAYGRRTKEKVKGTKNDYQMKRNDDYILTEGQHKGIVSEEVWEKAHAKRLRTGVKQPSKIGRDRVHLLSGLLKCPVCGSPMYTNKHAWTNKDGTYKEIYYYVCSRNRMVRGKHCEYKAMLKKTDIEPMVIEAIREIVRNEEYAQAIKKRIGVQIDTKAVDKELEGYQAKLKEVDLNKTRLEREIDSLPADAKYRERKLHDMTLRLDSLYDVIVELEEKIEDARLRRDAIKQQAITLENIYKIMVNFDCVYNIINDEEKRNVVTALIKEIEIYRNDESEYPLKRIGLNFPVFKDGGEVTELLWDKGNTVDTIGLSTLFLFQVQVDGGKDQNSRNDRQRAGQLDHRCKVAGCFTESVTGGYNARSIIDRRTGPETECGIRKPKPPAKEREHNDHHRIEQEGGGHTVGDVHVIGLDHRCNGGNGRAAADAGSGVDQAAGFPVEPERFANQRAQSKAGGQGEEHDRQRKTAHGQHGADVQAGTQKDDGEFQDLLRGEFDAGRGCFVGLEKRIDGHADKQGDD